LTEVEALLTDWFFENCHECTPIQRNTHDELGVAPHVVEACTNHISGEAKKCVAGTFSRAQYLKERTRALQAWADELERIIGRGETKVIALHG
jgi:hypothetical protein